MTRGEVKNSDAYICAQAESPNTVTREVDAPGEALGGGRKRYVDSIWKGDNGGEFVFSGHVTEVYFDENLFLCCVFCFGRSHSATPVWHYYS